MIFYILDDKCRGWWRLSDIEDVNQLEATLNSRGTREQHLLTLVKRNFELLQDAAKKWGFFLQVLYFIVFGLCAALENSSNCNGKPQNRCLQKKTSTRTKNLSNCHAKLQNQAFSQIVRSATFTPFLTNEIVLTRKPITNKQTNKHDSFSFMVEIRGN